MRSSPVQRSDSLARWFMESRGGVPWLGAPNRVVLQCEILWPRRA